MRTRSATLVLAGACALLGTPANAEVPRVVASIKPIHSLVASVMGDLGTPALLIDGLQSPHTYAMRPSDAAKVDTADLVVWVGPGIETFLQGPIETLAGDANVLELVDAEGLRLLPVREGGRFEAHVHGEEEHGHAQSESEGAAHEHGHDHDHGGEDAHVWLDPANAKIMLARIAERLGELDPENAATYAANATAEVSRLDTLADEIRAVTAGVHGGRFITFHDAFQYFEVVTGTEATASVAISPEIAPGARRIAELQAIITETDTRCLIAEPQFPRPIIDTLATETTRLGILDPNGAALEAGPDHYRRFMLENATFLAECLAPPA